MLYHNNTLPDSACLVGICTYDMKFISKHARTRSRYKEGKKDEIIQQEDIMFKHNNNNKTLHFYFSCMSFI